MSPSEFESTAALLRRVRDGDQAARDHLLARYLPVLQRWARGRLPPGSRDLSDTDDLVQVTLIRAVNRLMDFEPRREGAFLAYPPEAMLWRYRPTSDGERFLVIGSADEATPHSLRVIVGWTALLDR